MQRFSRTERLLSLFTTLRPGEGKVAVQLCLHAFLIMFAYYLLKVIREPMILATGNAELKAYSSALQAGLLMVIVPLFARFYQAVHGMPLKHHLFRNTLAFFIGNLLLFALAHQLGRSVAIAFYVWLGIFSVMVLALFWAYAADLFNLRSGQRIFPLVAAAAALGALLGSGLASRLDLALGHAGVMLSAAALLCVPWWLSQFTELSIPRGSGDYTPEQDDSQPYSLLAGFQIVWSSSYLSLIAVFVIVLNLINSNGEYILASFITSEASALSTGTATANAGAASADAYITRFYSRYLFLTTGLGFLIQLLLVARIFKRIGITGALYILPVLMIANYSLIALLPTLVVVRGVMMLENSVNYSLQTTTRHALFLPMSREQKYVGKHTIDTFFFRVGDVLSGSFIFLASAVIGLGVVGFVIVNALLAVLLLALSRAIGSRHRSYARNSVRNMPPIVATPLADMKIPAGTLTRIQLDPDTFIDPDVGDALRYEAYRARAGRLPGWVKFDPLNRSFDFHPPDASRGTLNITVVARDYEGLEAELNFTIYYGA